MKLLKIGFRNLGTDHPTNDIIPPIEQKIYMLRRYMVYVVDEFDVPILGLIPSDFKFNFLRTSDIASGLSTSNPPDKVSIMSPPGHYLVILWQLTSHVTDTGAAEYYADWLEATISNQNLYGHGMIYLNQKIAF